MLMAAMIVLMAMTYVSDHAGDDCNVDGDADDYAAASDMVMIQ